MNTNKLFTEIKKKISLGVFVGVIAIITIGLVAISVKGNRGDPIAYQEIHESYVEGPFESTNSNSRYALTESIATKQTFLFDEDLAKFAAPDLVTINGRFFSIFTPGVSFIGVPFYMVGQLVGMPQLFTYFSTHIFALLNVVLVAILTMKLGGKLYHGILAGLVFLFATNALPYALTFTQHHVSTTIILLGILNAQGTRNLKNNLLFGALFGAGLLMDIPNAFLLLPVALYVLYKNFAVEELSEKVKIHMKIGIVGLLLGLIPFITVYGWYNYKTAGSFTTIAQFVGRSDYPVPVEKFEVKNKKIEEKNPQPKLFEIPFDTRLQANGMYILLVSDERGIFFYSPILLLGVLGLSVALRGKENKAVAMLMFSIIGMNVVLYSMFGDPWGGWSFGPRYLIPATALLATGVGIAVWRFARNPLFALGFFILLAYSVVITFAGALTTNAIPPRGEAQNLTVPIPHTYAYNFDFIDKNQSGSLLYNLFFIESITLQSGLFAISTVAIMLIGSVYFVCLWEGKKIKSQDVKSITLPKRTIVEFTKKGKK